MAATPFGERVNRSKTQTRAEAIEGNDDLRDDLGASNATSAKLEHAHFARHEGLSLRTRRAMAENGVPCRSQDREVHRFGPHPHNVGSEPSSGEHDIDETMPRRTLLS